jgi:Ribbon-helix-helix protein, copG family.
MSGQENKVVIYLKVDRELVRRIDEMRKTPHGEIPRSQMIEAIIRKHLEEEEKWK